MDERANRWTGRRALTGAGYWTDGTGPPAHEDAIKDDVEGGSLPHPAPLLGRICFSSTVRSTGRSYSSLRDAIYFAPIYLASIYLS